MRYKNTWNLLITLLLFSACQAKLELSVTPDSGDKQTRFRVDYEIIDVEEPHNLRIILVKCHLNGTCSTSKNMGEKVVVSEKVVPSTGSYEFTLNKEGAWLYRFCGTYSGYGSDCDKGNQFLLQNNPGLLVEKEVIKWKEREPNLTLNIKGLPEKMVGGETLNFTVNATNHLNQSQNITLNAYAYNHSRLATLGGWDNQEEMTIPPFSSLLINKSLSTKNVSGYYLFKIKVGEHYAITPLNPNKTLPRTRKNRTRWG